MTETSDPLRLLARRYFAMMALIIAMLLPLLWRHAANNADRELVAVHDVMVRAQEEFRAGHASYATDLDDLQLSKYAKSPAEVDAVTQLLTRDSDLVLTEVGDWCLSVDAHVRYYFGVREYPRHVIGASRWPSDKHCPVGDR